MGCRMKTNHIIIPTLKLFLLPSAIISHILFLAQPPPLSLFLILTPSLWFLNLLVMQLLFAVCSNIKGYFSLEAILAAPVSTFGIHATGLLGPSSATIRQQSVQSSVSLTPITFSLAAWTKQSNCTIIRSF